MGHRLPLQFPLLLPLMMPMKTQCPMGDRCEVGYADALAISTLNMYTVKILYTFDDDNKTNCLARFPHALNIPTVALDNNTQIGVIELKKCIEAIVNARYALFVAYAASADAFNFTKFWELARSLSRSLVKIIPCMPTTILNTRHLSWDKVCFLGCWLLRPQRLTRLRTNLRP